MDERCESYLDDPARFAGHAETCPRCGKLMAELDGLDRALRSDLAEGGGIGPLALPLAPWEGAHYRAWKVVLAVAALLALTVAAGFIVAGISPVRGFAEAVGAQAVAGGDFVSIARAAGAGLQQAPPNVRLALAALFVAVNGFLFLLLRRHPRGVDETAR